MKTFSDFVKRLLKWFLYIVPGVIVVCGIGYMLYGVEMIKVNVLWEILFSAFVTALATALMQIGFSQPEEDNRVSPYFKLIIHYILLCVIMSFLGAWFGWVTFNIYGVLAMALYVGVVYFLTCAVYYIIDVKQADKINKKLREKFGDKEE